MNRILLVGELNPYGADPRAALYQGSSAYRHEVDGSTVPADALTPDWREL